MNNKAIGGNVDMRQMHYIKQQVKAGQRGGRSHPRGFNYPNNYPNRPNNELYLKLHQEREKRQHFDDINIVRSGFESFCLNSSLFHPPLFVDENMDSTAVRSIYGEKIVNLHDTNLFSISKPENDQYNNLHKSESSLKLFQTLNQVHHISDFDLHQPKHQDSEPRPKRLTYNFIPPTSSKHSLTDLIRSTATDLEIDVQAWELNNIPRLEQSAQKYQDIQNKLFEKNFI